MFIGHFAAAFGAKKLAPGVSLGVLFLACQLADLLWPNLVLLRLEHFAIDPGNTALTPLAFESYPYSHSLVGLTIWSSLLAGAYWVLARSGPRAAAVIGGLVLSHWLLDVLTHRADMPVAFDAATRIGLGLWNRPVAAIGTELALFAAGVWLYARSTVARDRIGRIGLWALVAFLAVAHIANLLSPPPPSTTTVAWSAQAMWLIVAWGYWIDGHRHARGGPPPRIA
ncbi:MAG TPA: hypothetical protein VLD39_06250 [Gammaproteobacteria bacterium]|nr:hypothetical protein [Gammaproteobacteria bacterium]